MLLGPANDLNDWNSAQRWYDWNGPLTNSQHQSRLYYRQLASKHSLYHL